MEWRSVRLDVVEQGGRSDLEGHEQLVVSCEAFDLDVTGEWT